MKIGALATTALLACTLAAPARLQEPDGDEEVKMRTWLRMQPALKARLQRAADLDHDGELNEVERELLHKAKLRHWRKHQKKLRALLDRQGKGRSIPPGKVGLDEEEEDEEKDRSGAKASGNGGGKRPPRSLDLDGNGVVDPAEQALADWAKRLRREKETGKGKEEPEGTGSGVDPQGGGSGKDGKKKDGSGGSGAGSPPGAPPGN